MLQHLIRLFYHHFTHINPAHLDSLISPSHPIMCCLSHLSWPRAAHLLDSLSHFSLSSHHQTALVLIFLDLSRADVLCMLVFLALLVAWRSRRGAVVLVVGRARPARRAREREGHNIPSLRVTGFRSAPSEVDIFLVQ